MEYIFIKSNVEIIVAFFDFNKLKFSLSNKMYFVCELSILFVCIFYNRKNRVYNDCFDNRKMEYIIEKKMEYIIVGGNLCIQHPLLQITQVIPPPLILNITNLLFLNKTNFAIIVVMVHKEDLWLLLTFNLFIMISFDNAVASLRKAGATSENVTICNVTVKDCDKWTRIALTLDKEVTGYVVNEDGEYIKGTTRVVFTSLYSIVGTLKNTDDTRAIASYVVTHPTALQILLSSAKCELLQEEIAANATYINHFTGEEVENESNHDSIFNHLVSITLSDKGLRAVEKIEDKLLGF